MDKELFREFKIDSGSINDESRTVDLSFSSEEPYKRYTAEYGEVWEVLNHKSEAVNLERLNNGAPLLVNHNVDDQVGVVERADLSDGRGIAKVRFGKSQRAQEIYQDVIDGIRKNVSVGYNWTKAVQDGEGKDGKPILRVDFYPFEISLASVPADNSVGVGRSDETIIENKETEMSEVKEEKVEVEVKSETKPEIDVKAIYEKANGEERKRVAEIMAIVDDYPELYTEAQSAIVEGRSENEFKSEVLKRIKEMEKDNKVDVTPEIGLTKEETKRYSILNVVRSLVEGRPDIAGFERECSDAVMKKMKLDAPRGFYMPYEAMQRDQTVGTDTAGGNLVATNLLAGSFIDRLKKDLVTGQMGATVLDGLVGNVAIPRMTSGSTGYWVSEGSAPTESATAYDQVSLTPKTVAAYVDMSRQLMMQSTPSIENLVRDDIRFVLAEAIDLAAIDGTGANNQPTGVLQTSGISNGDWSTASTPTWGEVVGLESTLGTANALKGNLAYLTTPAFAGTMKTTLKDSSVSGYIMEEGNMLNGYPCLKSNNCQASTLIFGNWRDLIIGLWGTLDITVDPYSLSTSGGVRIAAFQSCDIAVRHAASFAVEENAGS